MHPLVTVIIPAYNVEDYIVPAINSVLLQSFHDMQIIVVDDGSTDSTADRVLSIHDERLTLITKENGGVAAARNTGILRAKGKYIALLDGDDLWLPGKLQLQIDFMESDPSIGLSYTTSAYINERGLPTGHFLISTVLEPTYRDVIIRNCIAPSSAVIRKEYFFRAGMFNEALSTCADYEMWVRLLHSTACKARLIPKPLTGYRLRATSMMINYDTYLDDAERAMRIFRGTIPEFHDRLRRRAMAEHLRIASWKASGVGDFRTANVFLRKCILMDYTLIFTDIRAFGATVVLPLRSILPHVVGNMLYDIGMIILRCFYAIYSRIS